MIIQFCETYHFADDTNLLAIGKSVKKLQKRINIDLRRLMSWLLANKISLNKTKTELIIFHKPRDKIPDINIKLNGHKLTPTTTIKYLGIYLDDTLSGDFHCTQLLNKLERANAMLSKVRHFVPQDKLISIYYAILASHLFYGCQIWGINPKSPLFKKVENQQKRAMRLITFSKYDNHSEPLFKSLKILKIKDYISLLNCLLIHDHSQDLLPSSFDDYFIQCTDLGNTDGRRAGLLFIPFTNSVKYGSKSIKLTAIHTWNDLSETLDLNFFNMSKHKLKITLTNHFLNSYSS